MTFPQYNYKTSILLIDDSAYKAVRNPPHTAIHPVPYTVATHEFMYPCVGVSTSELDNALLPDGKIRNYLRHLLETRVLSVPEFVARVPF